MARAYEFFEHTADIGVTVYGATLKELFQNAARAMYAVLGEFELKDRTACREICLRAQSLEDLLHDWLAELLYELETRRVFYDAITVTELTTMKLTATVAGGEIDMERSRPHEEIKAVTYHQLTVEQNRSGQWQARIIFDV
jgi:SHS2 domain-containing protein